MRRILLGTACAMAVGALVACGNGSGGRDGAANGRVITAAGCIAQGGDGGYVLAPKATSGTGAVGTAGTHQQRYKLIDDGNVGVARWVNREATVTGKVERSGAENTTANPTDGRVADLPSLRVSQLNGGGECTPAQ